MTDLRSVDEPWVAAAAVSLQVRRERAALLEPVRGGDTQALIAVLEGQPDALAAWPIIDIIRTARGRTIRSRPAWLERMGSRAVRENVNLMVPLGRASIRTRSWVIEYVLHNLPHRRCVRRNDMRPGRVA